MVMDIVYIRDLRIETIIGIFAWEREVLQTVSLDLEMAADIRPAAASDDIKDALDYKAISKRLIQFVSQSQFQSDLTKLKRTCAAVSREATQ